MRAVLLVVLLAACGGSSRGPAWPKERVVEDDGGESIAPRPSTAALAEDEEEEIELDLPVVETKVEAKKDEKKPETPTGVTPVGTTPEEPILTTEEIVIEIED